MHLEVVNKKTEQEQLSDLQMLSYFSSPHFLPELLSVELRSG
jgi:hypothetical protein